MVRRRLLPGRKPIAGVIPMLGRIPVGLVPRRLILISSAGVVAIVPIYAVECFIVTGQEVRGGVGRAENNTTSQCF